MTDILRRAADRFRIPESCNDCIATSPLRYVGLTPNNDCHVFRCVTCKQTVLFDRIAKDFKRDDADVIPIGGARVDGGPSHSIDPVTDNEVGGDAA